MNQLPTSIIDYGNGIYAIDQQMVRAFLIVGKESAILLDTGVFHVDIRTYIKEITNLPVKVFLTHGDGDHTGNLESFPVVYINENEEAAVRGHENCKEVAFRYIKEGDVFDIGERKLQVLFTPGHTNGSICLLDKEKKILFSGDTVSYGPVYMFGAKRNIANYLSSLHRLKEMREEGCFSTVYCCHNTCPISADTIDSLIDCVNGYLDKTITPEQSQISDAAGNKQNICRYKKCAILVD